VADGESDYQLPVEQPEPSSSLGGHPGAVVVSKKAAIKRGLGRAGRWLLGVVGSAVVDLIVDKTTKKAPGAQLKISHPGETDQPTDRFVGADQFVLPGTYRARMLTHPDELREVIRREREKHL